VSNTLKVLTLRQRTIVDFIADFITTKGYSPSMEEIATALNLTSLATVHKHVSNLTAKGWLTRDYNRSRSIALTPEAMADFRKRARKKSVHCPQCNHEFQVGA
jgi:repressor LexA